MVIVVAGLGTMSVRPAAFERREREREHERLADFHPAGLPPRNRRRADPEGSRELRLCQSEPFAALAEFVSIHALSLRPCPDEIERHAQYCNLDPPQVTNAR